jgi:hypothetical protein
MNTIIGGYVSDALCGCVLHGLVGSNGVMINWEIIGTQRNPYSRVTSSIMNFIHNHLKMYPMVCSGNPASRCLKRGKASKCF